MQHLYRELNLSIWSVAEKRRPFFQLEQHIKFGSYMALMKIISHFFCKMKFNRNFLVSQHHGRISASHIFLFFYAQLYHPTLVSLHHHWFKTHFESDKTGVGLQYSTTRTTIFSTSLFGRYLHTAVFWYHSTSKNLKSNHSKHD